MTRLLQAGLDGIEFAHEAGSRDLVKLWSCWTAQEEQGTQTPRPRLKQLREVQDGSGSRKEKHGEYCMPPKHTSQSDQLWQEMPKGPKHKKSHITNNVFTCIKKRIQTFLFSVIFASWHQGSNWTSTQWWF